MSEAIIARKGPSNRSSNGNSFNGSRFITEVIVKNTNWVMPSNVINNTISVRIFGAGGGGIVDAGGGGGWMNNGDLILTEGELVPITIGIGTRRNGGTTSFGTYLSANGGGAANDTHAGSGGSGGGSVSIFINGGIGYQFGGGGVSDHFIYNNCPSVVRAGNGGIWGGGGGLASTIYDNNTFCDKTFFAGSGGTYGGGGGTSGTSSGGNGICIIQYYAKS